MEYEIVDFQTVTVNMSGNELDSENITIAKVLFSWGNGYTNESRIEFKGVPTDQEVMASISNRGNELKSQSETQVARNIPMKGTL